MPWLRLLPLVIVSVGLGSLFGSAEVVIVAFADEAGNRGIAGWMLAAWATGSMLAGLIVGARAARGHALDQLRWSATALTAMMAVLIVIPTVGWVDGGAVLRWVRHLPRPHLVDLAGRAVRAAGAADRGHRLGRHRSGGRRGARSSDQRCGRRPRRRLTAFAAPVVSGAVAVAAAWAIRRPDDREAAAAVGQIAGTT
jgi:hypothetical protein